MAKQAPIPSESLIIKPRNWTEILDLAEHFDLARPLEVDVGCGKGRFLAARAQATPGANFLGIDRLLVRLHRANRKCERLGVRNVRLLRIEASYAVDRLLPDSSVSVFYIFFPDPWPKLKHHRRRLFNAAFRDSVFRTLLPGGCIHVATDHRRYFEEIRVLFGGDNRFRPAATFQPSEKELTDFETMFRGRGHAIERCSFLRGT